MTSQLMSNPSSTLSRSESSAVKPAPNAQPSKSVYQADQQVKLMNLQADVDSLLLQLQTLKQQRLTPSSELAFSQTAACHSN